MRYTPMTIPSLIKVDYQVESGDAPRKNILDPMPKTEIDDNNDPYHQYLHDTEAQNPATADLHKALLGTRNPGLGYMAKRAQPALYDADTLLHPTHHPVSIWDSEEVLVHQVVSMKKMNEKPGHVRPAHGFYKANALMFVPQSGNCHPRIIKERTTQKPDYVSEWCFDYAKQFVEQQLVPFYDHFKKHIQAANETFFKEIREFEQIFDELTEIQLDGLKVENVSLKRRYDELSQANTHSRTANTEKLSALTAENTKLKAQVTGKTCSGPSTSETPKVLASRNLQRRDLSMLHHPKRANWEKAIPLPKKNKFLSRTPQDYQLDPHRNHQMQQGTRSLMFM
ncbi:hypothetical protein Tco_0561396 [Tanacetum coccineum]